MQAEEYIKEHEHDIIEYFSVMTAGLFDRFNCCAAGGAVVDYLRKGSVKENGDIDVYLLDGARDLDRARDWMSFSGYREVHASAHAILFSPNAGHSMCNINGKIEEPRAIHLVISKPSWVNTGQIFENATKVISSFDITASRIAVAPDKITTSRGFLISMDKNIVSLGRISNFDALLDAVIPTWITTVQRFSKYCTEKGFEYMDDTFFALLEKASLCFDMSGQQALDFSDRFTSVSEVYSSFGMDPINTMGYEGTVSMNINGGHGQWSTSSRQSGSECKEWRKLYDEDKLYSLAIQRIQREYNDSLFMETHMTTLAKMIINSNLKFPVELLERRHNSFFSERFCRELAWVVYTETGSDIDNFTARYNPERHYPFPDFNEPNNIVNPKEVPAVRQSADFLYSKGMHHAILRNLEKHIYDRDVQKARKILDDKSFQMYTNFYDRFGAPWQIIKEWIGSATFADMMLFQLNEDVFCRLVSLGATPSKNVLQGINLLEHGLLRESRFSKNPRDVERLESLRRMLAFADEHNYFNRESFYREQRNEQILSGQFANEKLRDTSLDLLEQETCPSADTCAGLSL